MKTGIHRQSVSVLGRIIALITTAIAVGHAATAAESSPAEVSGPFYSSLGREFDASMNSFWRSHCLGQSGPGPKEPMLGGRKWWGIPVSASDSDWIELKLAWHHDPECLRTLGRWLREIPFDSNGYVWAAADGRQHLRQHTLWHNNADFINALWEFWRWNGDVTWLTEAVPTTEAPPGISVLDRARLAMRYQLDESGMRGLQHGVLVIPDPDHDGTPQPVARRAGASMPSTYYDLVRSGHKEAFVNVRFLKSLANLAALEEAAGFPGRAAALRTQLARSRDAFHRTFWNPATGRYAGWVDANGKMWDYGEVVPNLQALLWAEPPADAVRSILDWVSGRRIVSGDTSTGADIYHWGFAPRKNTLAYESLGTETNHWWGAWFWDFRPDGTGRGNFGNQEENGGTNPFIAYYDIMARLKHNGPEDAWARFQALMHDFARDQFHRPTAPDPNHPGERFKSYVLDLPEAGLPLMAVLHGFMGVNPDGVELRVQPALPPGIEFLGVTRLGFRGLRHTVETRADGTVSIKTGTTPPME